MPAKNPAKGIKRGHSVQCIEVAIPMMPRSRGLENISDDSTPVEDGSPSCTRVAEASAPGSGQAPHAPDKAGCAEQAVADNTGVAQGKPQSDLQQSKGEECPIDGEQLKDAFYVNIRRRRVLVGDPVSAARVEEITETLDSFFGGQDAGRGGAMPQQELVDSFQTGCVDDEEVNMDQDLSALNGDGFSLSQFNAMREEMMAKQFGPPSKNPWASILAATQAAASLRGSYVASINAHTPNLAAARSGGSTAAQSRAVSRAVSRRSSTVFADVASLQEAASAGSKRKSVAAGSRRNSTAQRGDAAQIDFMAARASLQPPGSSRGSLLFVSGASPAVPSAPPPLPGVAESTDQPDSALEQPGGADGPGGAGSAVSSARIGTAVNAGLGPAGVSAGLGAGGGGAVNAAGGGASGDNAGTSGAGGGITLVSARDEIAMAEQVLGEKWQAAGPAAGASAAPRISVVQADESSVQEVAQIRAVLNDVGSGVRLKELLQDGSIGECSLKSFLQATCQMQAAQDSSNDTTSDGHTALHMGELLFGASAQPMPAISDTEDEADGSNEDEVTSGDGSGSTCSQEGDEEEAEEISDGEDDLTAAVPPPWNPGVVAVDSSATLSIDPEMVNEVMKMLLMLNTGLQVRHCKCKPGEAHTCMSPVASLLQSQIQSLQQSLAQSLVQTRQHSRRASAGDYKFQKSFDDLTPNSACSNSAPSEQTPPSASGEKPPPKPTRRRVSRVRGSTENRLSITTTGLDGERRSGTHSSGTFSAIKIRPPGAPGAADAGAGPASSTPSSVNS